MRKMRMEYWSCSKFADLIRGTTRPLSGTSEEWSLWEKKAKKKKIRYWLAEEGLDHLQNFIFWPFNRLDDIRYNLKCRYFSKTHALTSNLKRGEYHEFDTRLLHSTFDELVNFIEIEEAWMNIICDADKKKKWLLKRHRWLDHLFGWRNAEAGLDRLRWAASLKHDEEWIDKTDPDYGKPTSQAICAQEMLELYHWWKHERPKRPEPMDASGLSDYYEEKSRIAKEKGEDPDFVTFSDIPEEDQNHWRKLSDAHHKLEQDFDNEDTAMSIRLIKIRRGVWT